MICLKNDLDHTNNGNESTNVPRLCKLPISVGMVAPSNRLSAIHSSSNAPRVPIAAGIVPVNALLDILNCLRSLRESSDSKGDPAILLPSTSINVRVRGSFTSGPPMMLPETSSRRRRSIPINSLGSDPLRLLSPVASDKGMKMGLSNPYL